MARDQASGVIKDFAILMACVILGGVGAACLLWWALWRLVRALVVA